MVDFSDIRFDCVLYTGYKPCRYGNECKGCWHYEPREPYAAEPATPVRVLAPPRDVRDDSPYKILIIKTGAMGDVLRTTTLLAPLVRMYPEASITWVTDKSAVPLLIHNPKICRLFVLDETTEKLLVTETFDLLLNFEKDPAPLALAGRVPARVHRGFAPTIWNTPTVFNASSVYALLLGISDELKFHINEKTYPQIIAEMAEIPYQRDPYELYLPEVAATRRARLAEQLPNAAHPWIGLNTGCGSVFRTKLWPVERWVELINELKQQVPQATLLLLGGPAERDMNKAILSASEGLVDTGCDNSLDEFFGIIDACDIVVSSDSLAMHIAIALRKYVVALFGSTSPVEIDLYDRGEKVITDFDCSPCYLKQCDKVPTCMQAMTGREVANAVLRVIRTWEKGS
ncbi:MAG: glycosyltransferase family 9 protein [Candidatus Sumerlaeaceae bacterium]|nr:glycosyltransferase family 9 protein [Candidatus Sumerlaeaceae bacterium]